MKLLFDTHTFIWWDSQPHKLSAKSLALLSNSSNIKFLSIVSIWEMQIKYQLGKLSLQLPLRDIINEQIHNHNIVILSITSEHILGLDNLPLHHKDPFDRLLISQANLEDAILISCDSVFNQYSVKVDW
ncbi:type II toxin-antitoxin system VapC family toxin [Anabaena sp. UHCC 0451]|uniref:type II toxin-antitoxin system VapC family toxin n=1 Tax=Anabaena TaxID=1163 RepID=UPI00297887F3|nr:type II toxin-antitoxin system VapC family toxin [Anabaena sp. UHCC 0451]MEA5578352.1 type II toxin-antitoxin system VapC family toxin [Anabaena sp. UHCC 0451]TAF07971.1 MAG: type II toxin-antitoxin system VapC family toxin [Nostocales cyanobacterium]